MEVGDEANTPAPDTYTFIVTAKEALRAKDPARSHHLGGLRPWLSFARKAVEIEAVLWDGNMTTIEPLLSGSSCDCC